MSAQGAKGAAMAALGLTTLAVAAERSEAAYFTHTGGGVSQDSGGFVDIFSAGPSEDGIDLFADTSSGGTFVEVLNPDTLFLSSGGDIVAALAKGDAAIISDPIQPGESIRATLTMDADFMGFLSLDELVLDVGLFAEDASKFDETLTGELASAAIVASGQQFQVVIETDPAAVGGYGEWGLDGLFTWATPSKENQRMLDFDLDIAIEVVPAPGAAGLAMLGGLAAVRRRR